MTDEEKLVNYDNLESLYKMEKSNNYILSKQNEEMRKNYMATNRLKDKKIRELTEEINRLKNKQISMFGENL